MRTWEEIEVVISEAVEDSGKFPGMSYADGVANALEWVLDHDTDNPMAD